MNSRWTARVIGILMLIGFLLLLAHLQKRLIEMQRMQRATTTTSTSGQSR